MRNKKIFSFLLCVTSIALIQGCTQTKYNWGGYEDALALHYQNPAKSNLEQTIESVIKKAKGSRPVPPGLYAEYGYLLLEKGSTDKSVQMFMLEKKHWPESTTFMDKMIALAGENTAGNNTPRHSSMTAEKTNVSNGPIK